MEHYRSPSHFARTVQLLLHPLHLNIAATRVPPVEQFISSLRKDIGRILDPLRSVASQAPDEVLMRPDGLRTVPLCFYTSDDDSGR